MATVPRTTAKGVPKGSLVVDAFGGMTVERFPPSDAPLPRPIPGVISDGTPVLEGETAPAEGPAPSAQIALDAAFGVALRTGVADMADVGMTIDGGGALLDLKLELVDVPVFALAVDVGGGLWEGRARGFQLQGGLLADVVVGDVRTTIGAGYGWLVGVHPLHVLTPAISTEIPLSPAFALVPAFVAFVPLAGEDDACLQTDPEWAGGGTTYRGGVLCDEARRTGFVGTLGIRFRLGRGYTVRPSEDPVL
jgi:hypothetical protein